MRFNVRMKIENKLPVFLLGAYLLEFILLGINPYERSVWFAENIPMVMIVAILVSTYPLFQFSSLSYVMMFCLIFLHTIGGHYTFERVPFDFVNNLLGYERNMYDRLAHFTVGFYAYPIAELLHRKRGVNSRWILFLFPVFAIFTVASTYEIFEWIYGVTADPEAGLAVLGSQGDIWDAQKDMLSDGLGSLFAMALFWMIGLKRPLLSSDSRRLELFR